MILLLDFKNRVERAVNRMQSKANASALASWNQ